MNHGHNIRRGEKTDMLTDAFQVHDIGIKTWCGSDYSQPTENHHSQPMPTVCASFSSSREFPPIRWKSEKIQEYIERKVPGNQHVDHLI